MYVARAIRYVIMFVYDIIAGSVTLYNTMLLYYVISVYA